MTTIAKLMGSGVPAAQAQATTAGVPLSGLAAAGVSSQANATLITSDLSVFTTVPASTAGARLPAASAPSLTAQAGDIFVVVNSTATAMNVYPPVGGNFAGVAVNTAVVLPAAKVGDFYCLGNNVWAASIGG
ncbi:hypothetical protein [Caballeronia sp. ATUFL_M1_KS5A]|uniref:hypothetical protein n=1 Tax=Caballeronia sp. ATUFL_M1_KS5A TaxID=2921778 RepID=UPI0020289DC6|nr:hypothetical protein [Caballeronia sp. ATUFL_M1_KS5A]